MFGKRSGTATSEAPRVAPRATPPGGADTPPKAAASAGAEAPPKIAPAAPPPPRPAAAPVNPKPAPRTAVIDTRSDDYYQIKSTIFSALIDTIDLAQLAQLDPDSA